MEQPNEFNSTLNKLKFNLDSARKAALYDTNTSDGALEEVNYFCEALKQTFGFQTLNINYVENITFWTGNEEEKLKKFFYFIKDLNILAPDAVFSFTPNVSGNCGKLEVNKNAITALWSALGMFSGNIDYDFIFQMLTRYRFPITIQAQSGSLTNSQAGGSMLFSQDRTRSFLDASSGSFYNCLSVVKLCTYYPAVEQKEIEALKSFCRYYQINLLFYNAKPGSMNEFTEFFFRATGNLQIQDANKTVKLTLDGYWYDGKFILFDMSNKIQKIKQQMTGNFSLQDGVYVGLINAFAAKTANLGMGYVGLLEKIKDYLDKNFVYQYNSSNYTSTFEFSPNSDSLILFKLMLLEAGVPATAMKIESNKLEIIGYLPFFRLACKMGLIQDFSLVKSFLSPNSPVAPMPYQEKDKNNSSLSSIAAIEEGVFNLSLVSLEPPVPVAISSDPFGMPLPPTVGSNGSYSFDLPPSSTIHVGPINSRYEEISKGLREKKINFTIDQLKSGLIVLTLNKVDLQKTKEFLNEIGLWRQYDINENIINIWPPRYYKQDSQPAQEQYRRTTVPDNLGSNVNFIQPPWQGVNSGVPVASSATQRGVQGEVIYIQNLYRELNSNSGQPFSEQPVPGTRDDYNQRFFSGNPTTNSALLPQGQNYPVNNGNVIGQQGAGMNSGVPVASSATQRGVQEEVIYIQNLYRELNSNSGQPFLGQQGQVSPGAGYNPGFFSGSFPTNSALLPQGQNYTGKGNRDNNFRPG